METGASLEDAAARLRTDPRAVETAYVLLAPMVLGYLRRVLPPADAEDVLQRTFLDVWRSREQYDPSRPLGGWVMGIAKHRAMDHLRRRQPEQTFAEVPEDVASDTEDLADRFARSLEVRDALQKLSDEQRQVLVLVYFNDLSLPQVAEWVGAPLGTVKARAARGLKALGAHMGRTAL